MPASIKYILSIDLGTGGPKVALVSTQGEVVESEFEETRLLLLPEGGAEQSPQDTLRRAGIPFAGAGRDDAEAGAPAIKTLAAKGRIIVFGFGVTSSGIPRRWAAAEDRPGVNLLPDYADRTIERIATQVRAVKRPGDVVVASVHWGGNWGYDIEPDAQSFARDLIAAASIDLGHGHSSHHAKGIELFQGKLILHGCGDFINDYEGITGYKEFRDDLSVLYLADIDPRPTSGSAAACRPNTPGSPRARRSSISARGPGTTSSSPEPPSARRAGSSAST